jgi:hypothetical protein
MKPWLSNYLKSFNFNNELSQCDDLFDNWAGVCIDVTSMTVSANRVTDPTPFHNIETLHAAVLKQYLMCDFEDEEALNDEAEAKS